MVNASQTVTQNGSQIAATIRQQIGLDSWLAVIAREPRWWQNSETGYITFTFRFGSRHGLSKWIDVAYNRATDLYDVKAYKLHRNGCKSTLKIPSEFEPDGYEYFEYEGIYAESLPDLVREINRLGEIV